MRDGKHCPECEKDIGVWPVLSAGLPSRVHCPHCHARLTYGNIGVFDPRPFREIPPGTRVKLFPWMYRYVEEGRVTGERYAGPWDNVGTAEQLAQLDRRLSR